MNRTPIAQFAGLERGRNGKLAVKFDVYAPAGYVAAQCTSAPVFMSYGAAFKGARRALAKVNTTGKFPNMCTTF